MASLVTKKPYVSTIKTITSKRASQPVCVRSCTLKNNKIKLSDKKMLKIFQKLVHVPNVYSKSTNSCIKTQIRCITAIGNRNE